jgi:2-polyprenyl-3-methyl-5-hydroxy-6-metoxy-1,4-benzoquinol methylase
VRQFNFASDNIFKNTTNLRKVKMNNINYYNNIREDVLKIIPAKNYQRLLEIGGGEFETLTKLADQYNAEAWGVDVYPCANKKINFVSGSIEDDATIEKIKDDSFDLIMANDVLEHLNDTEKFFATANKKLVNSGLLVLSVPNIRQIRSLYHIYINGTFPRFDSGLFDRTHLRWFCKKDVLDFSSRHSFKMIDFKSTGRLVPNLLSKTLAGEFLGLQNLFVFEKI